MDRPKKQLKIEEMQKVFDTNSVIIVVALGKISANQLFMVRQQLWQQKADLKITKNNLVKIALNMQGLSFLEDNFTGQTAILYSNDIVSLAKLVKQLSKEWKDKIKVLGGGQEKKLITSDDIQNIANLPPLIVLQAEIAALIGSSVVRQLTNCLGKMGRDVINILNHRIQKIDN